MFKVEFVAEFHRIVIRFFSVTLVNLTLVMFLFRDS